MRVLFVITYNGSSFFGSQIQKETSNTVLGTLEKALKQLGITKHLIASGRTDKGVHALGQVCHIDLPKYWSDLKKLRFTLNRMLPSTIYVKKIFQTKDDFHARYSAKKRTYRYFIKIADSNPFEADFITFVNDLDYDALKKNIKIFIGEHDFGYFMKMGSDVASTKRVIYKAFAYKHKSYIILNFQANGFLRSQIRLMVGALLHTNKLQIEEKLFCKYNHKIKLAPANGLYLSSIKY